MPPGSTNMGTGSSYTILRALFAAALAATAQASTAGATQPLLFCEPNKIYRVIGNDHFPSNDPYFGAFRKVSYCVA